MIFREKTTKEILEAGFSWYQNHKEHIDKMLNKHRKSFLKSKDYFGYSVKPSNEDALRPELWKPMHWQWFMDKLNGS